MDNCVPVVTATEFLSLKKSGNLVLLDVREKEEYDFTKVEGSLHIPLAQLEGSVSDFKSKHKDSKIVVICRSGMRSAMATEFMLESGFNHVYNLEGGLLALSKLDHSITPY